MACDSNGDFLVFWDHDDTDITLEFQVKTTGWFGFGISPAGTMAGADIITYSDGELKVINPYNTISFIYCFSQVSFIIVQPLSSEKNIKKASLLFVLFINLYTDACLRLL